MSRAKELRNDDTDYVALPAQGYFLGESEGDLVVAFDIAGKPQYALFLKADEAKEFLDRFTAEMEEMGWLQ